MPRARNWWWFIDRITDYEAHMHAIKRTLVTERTAFQEVGIMESPVYGKILILDGDMQSGQKDEFIYHESLVHPAMSSHEKPERVLILGGGEGATLREVSRYNCVKEIHMVDIDGELVELCKIHLPEWSQGSYNDPRLKLYITDAYKWIKENDLQFDVIISDLTEPIPDSPSADLFTVEFFNCLKSRLKKNGILGMQASRGDILDTKNHAALYMTLNEVFPIVRSYTTRVPVFDLIWTFLFCSETTDPKKIDRERIDMNLKEKIDSELRFFDGEIYTGMFCLPKYFRELRSQGKPIFKVGDIPSQNRQPAYII